MFYKMITAARDKWLASAECTIGSLISHIVAVNQMRDAQVDAIKTYLYLKIGCNNKPLGVLFAAGKFNTLDLDALEVSSSARDYLKTHPTAAALYEYAGMCDEKGIITSEKIIDQIKKRPESIDYARFWSDIFYGVTYTDYLFSLPMGAGKTFLMAAFIYLDLYFAANEPTNPAFAHNFIILAPSGLKSSVVPSLRTIQKFNPAWVLPEPAAGEIKRRLIFEVLDQAKTGSKSNKTKNPNVQKIALHQPLSELFGLVAVTNAEKVILDRMQEEDGRMVFIPDDRDERDRQANELRNLIGKIPSLSVFIDEVHHAVSDEIKLRAVINKWAEGSSVNSVIGFSGTPYLDKAEKVNITLSLSVATSAITNVVYYYPLIDGVGNFLKKPVVKISDVKDSAVIVEAGVRTFLDMFKDTVYEGGLTAKLGIYCGTIEKCEELVYPLVSRVVAEYGLPPESILKFHKGNKKYPPSADSQMQFDILDSPLSRVRIVLLVQIGKEGWDCRSLTGIVLSQEGDCPKNMVLQTSCRCLRQVVKHTVESALIYLNESNADKLNEQLIKEQHVTLKEFAAADHHKTVLKRYDRTAHLKLPPIDFCQLRINYKTVIIEEKRDIDEAIRAAIPEKQIQHTVTTTDISMHTLYTDVLSRENGSLSAGFNAWVYGIMRESLGYLTMADLTAHTEALREVFMAVTYEKDGERYYSSLYHQNEIAANIRKAFYEKRDFVTTEELIPEKASLLNIRNFTSTVSTDDVKMFFPEQKTVENIVSDDQGKLKVKPEIKTMLELAKSTGSEDVVRLLEKQIQSHPQKERTFHYLPYHADSDLEIDYFNDLISLSEIEARKLEVYYNGDRALTEFKIKCYAGQSGKWRYIGMYTPDFLIIQRKDGQIHKAIIVETKGSAFEGNFEARKKFMSGPFLTENNRFFGYERFDFLYVPDSMSASERKTKTYNRICEFFEEE